jgi:hypothetical protein
LLLAPIVFALSKISNQAKELPLVAFSIELI